MRKLLLAASLALFSLTAAPAGATGLVAASPGGPVRAFHLRVPSGAPPSGGWPLLILLHGGSFPSSVQDRYMAFGDIADAENFLYAYPDGSRLPDIGAPIWNGLGCCQFGIGDPIDDVGYIDAVIDTVIATGNPVSKVFLVGHSNGGILAHRYACERSRTTAPVVGIVSLGGPAAIGGTTCLGIGGRVSVLAINGTADMIDPFFGLPPSTIPFLGAPGPVLVPPAEETIRGWATHNGCGTTMLPGATPFDLDLGVTGPETTANVFPGCSGRGSVEFWVMNGSPHIPNIIRPPTVDSFPTRVFHWLMTH